MPTEIDHIFSIVLSDSSSLIAGKTEAFNLNIKSFQTCYPNAQHRIFKERRIRKVLANHFSAEVLDAYDTLIPYAYKADLARYCLLYIHGGLYSDISHLHLNPIQVEDRTTMVFFRDIAFIHPPSAVSNAIIYAQPGQALFYHLIQTIVEHCKSRFYGNSPLDPTGPYLLGRELAKMANFDDMLFGDSTAIMAGANSSKAKKHIMKFMPDGELIALRNKTNNSSIEEFFQGGNDYAALWQDRQVYGESSDAFV